MGMTSSPKVSQGVPMVSGVRILHTSDWHLGRLFHRSSLLDVQAEALDRIVQIVVEESVDLVVIAGDLYDRSVPPADAVELFGTTLVRLREAGATVVAISGNHDSSVRVGYADPLLARVGVTVRGDIARTAHPVEVPSTDGGPPVVVYPIPYLDPLTTAHVARRDRPAEPDAPPVQVEGGSESDRHASRTTTPWCGPPTGYVPTSPSERRRARRCARCSWPTRSSRAATRRSPNES